MIDRIFERTARMMELMLAIAFIGIVLLNFGNVVGRYAFGVAMNWADEIQIFTLIAITFLGTAVVTWRRQHLRMDVLYNLFPAPLRTLLKLVELLLMLGLSAFVMWHALDYTRRMFVIGRTSDTAGVPMWIVHAAVVFGFGLVVVVCLWQVVHALAHGRRDEAPAAPNRTREQP